MIISYINIYFLLIILDESNFSLIICLSLGILLLSTSSGQTIGSTTEMDMFFYNQNFISTQVFVPKGHKVHSSPSSPTLFGVKISYSMLGQLIISLLVNCKTWKLQLHRLSFRLLNAFKRKETIMTAQYQLPVS
jgi:hypothetical protein